MSTRTGETLTARVPCLPVQIAAEASALTEQRQPNLVPSPMRTDLRITEARRGGRLAQSIASAEEDRIAEVGPFAGLECRLTPALWPAGKTGCDENPGEVCANL